MRLEAEAAAAGFRLLAHDTLPSTNTEALALARRGEAGPLWVTARQQTAGRGRRGNAWISTPANLYATLLLYDPAAPESAPQLSFVAALAVFDAIVDRAAALREKLALKCQMTFFAAGKSSLAS
jgi:BirA family biotin operon repressor/biotin-[acetyl-CoA-carboxylase] ligase